MSGRDALKRMRAELAALMRLSHWVVHPGLDRIEQ